MARTGAVMIVAVGRGSAGSSRGPREGRTANLIADWYEERRLRILADVAGEGTILDVGYAKLPNTHFRSKVIGIDLAPAPPGCNYHETIIGDAMTVAELLPGRRFDSIVCGEFIEHMEEPYRFLRTIRPSIASHGRLIMSTPNPLAFPVVFAEITRSRRRFYSDDHTFYFLPRWAARLLDRSGYELERIVPVGLWNPWVPIPWAPVWMSYQLIYVARPRI